MLTGKLREKGVGAVLVGGQAIDFYTAGNFATSDIDLIVDNPVLVKNLLNKFGFGKEADGLWLNQDLNLVVQVISESYRGDTSKLKTVKIKDLELKVAAPEDLIQNRLCSLKLWQSNPQSDLEQSIALLKIFEGNLDNEYLDKIAREHDIEDVFAEARALAASL